MGLKVDDSRAPYLQMADDLRQAIRDGSLGPGDRLPSTRELMERYGVANMTVQNALRVLRDEGLIYGVPGRGSYVRSEISAADPAAEGEAHSPEYVAILRQLDEVTDELQRIADRVTQLEQRQDQGAKRAR
jgi:DNA-binding GntR family transcriptional regulator